MRAIAQDLFGATFSVPEPILIILKSIGNVVMANGQHVYPTFPDIADQVVNGGGGYYCKDYSMTTTIDSGDETTLPLIL